MGVVNGTDGVSGGGERVEDERRRVGLRSQEEIRVVYLLKKKDSKWK